MPEAANEKVTSVKVINTQNSLLPFQRVVKFSDDKKQEVSKDFQKVYEGWKSSTSNLRTQLAQWRNDAEGIFTGQEDESPWPGSCKIVKPIIETRINIIHSFWMSVLRPMIGRLFICITENRSDKAEVDASKDMELFFNTNHQFNKMYVDSSDEAFWALLGDGTVGRTVDWMRVVEKRWEIQQFTGIDEFIEKFPNPESAGVSPDTYLDFITKLNNGEPLALDVEKEVITVDRPDIDMENLKDIVIYPITVSRQDRARFVGRRFFLRKSELLAREKMKVYHNISKVIETTPVQKSDDYVETTQNAIDGITEVDEPEDYEMIHGRYSIDLDGDGIEEKYLVTYNVESKTFVQFDKFPFYHNSDFLRLSWFKRRPKRMLGRGVSQMLSDTQLETSIAARMRIDARSITNSPVVIANSGLKASLDPRRRENKIRPGTYLWVEEQKMDKALRPVEFPKRDFGDSNAEEASLNQSADNLLGASELRSGRETPNDPRAPAAKTALLLQQSTMRLDDFVFGYIRVENEILDLAKKLYYQFGPEKIKFTVPGPEGILSKEIDKSWFNSDTIHLQLVSTSLMDNPEFLLQKWEDFYQRYGPEPMLGGIPEVRWEILNQMMLNRPEARGKNILLPLEQIQQKITPLPLPVPAQNGSGVNPTLKSALGGLQ